MLSADAPGTYANGIGTNLDILDRVGDAALSTSNSQSYNMIPSDISPYVPQYVGDQIANNFSMTFDGVNDYFDLTQHDLGTINTISLWLNISSISTGQTLLGEPSNSYKQSVIIEGNIIYIKDVSNHYKGWNFSTSSEFSLNNWHHFGIVRSGSTVTFYIDGVGQGSPDNSSGAFTANTKFRYLGTDYPTNSKFVNGKLDELAIFDTALNAGQIYNDIYQPTSTGTNQTADLVNNPNLPNPVAWYRMGD